MSWLITSTRTDGALNRTPAAFDLPQQAAQCGHLREIPTRIDQRTRIQRLIQVRHPVEMRTHPPITNLTAACVQLWMTLQSCPMRTGDRHTSCESFLPRLVDMISPPCLLSAQIASFTVYEPYAAAAILGYTSANSWYLKVCCFNPRSA